MKTMWQSFKYNSPSMALMQPMDGRVTEAIAKVALKSKLPDQGYYIIDVVDSSIRVAIQETLQDSFKAIQ